MANAFTFEKELKTSLIVILERYFQKRLVLIYDMRDFQSHKKRSLLPSPATINLDQLIGLATVTEDTHVMIRDRTHDPTLVPVRSYNVYKATASIFVIEDYQAKDWPTMNEAFRIVKENESFVRQGTCLLLIHIRDSTIDLSKMAATVMAATWRWNKAVNVVVMAIQKDQFVFFNWFPYRQPHCRWIKPQEPIDLWRNGSFQKNVDLYPDKNLENLDGCPLRAVTDACAPYTWVDTDIVKNGKGIETRLMDLLQEIFNFKIEEVVLPAGESLWDTLWPNNTPAGAFAQLQEQKADLAFGCIMLNEERYNLAESLPVFYQDSLSWMIPTPTIKSHRYNVFDAFPEFYWMAVAVALLVSILAFIIILKLEEIALLGKLPDNLPGVAFKIFAMAISSPIALPTRSILIRAMSFLFAMYSLHITTTYQASLYQLYKSNQYLGVYETLTDTFDADLFVYLRASTKNMYRQSELKTWDRLMRQGRYSYYTNEIGDIFDEISLNKSAMALYIKSTFLCFTKWYYTNQDTREQSLTYLADPFASYPVAIFLSPGSPLFYLWSDMMHRVAATGLVDHWLQEIVDVGATRYKTTLATDVSLTFEHITGAFIFYGVLILAATIAFAGEFVVWLWNGKVVNVSPSREELNQRRRNVIKAIETIRLHGRLKRKRSIHENTRLQ